MPRPEPWATLRIRLDPPVCGAVEEADAADRLDELGAIIAGWPQVGGVETRDRTTSDAPTPPELWAYSVPDALAELEREAAALAGRFGLQVALETHVHEDEVWRDEWRTFHRPLVVGEGEGALLLRPSWLPRRPGDPEREVVIDPGRAFGTGLHASTRLCLDHLCRIADPSSRPFARILDLGCGSGILTLVAARLWSAPIVAVDTDPEATATTRENLAKNGLAHRVQVVTGRLEEGVVTPPFDLIVANILPAELAPLAPILAHHRTPDGVLVLGGILDQEADDVAGAYESSGVRETARHRLDGWCLLQMGGQEP